MYVLIVLLFGLETDDLRPCVGEGGSEQYAKAKYKHTTRLPRIAST